MSAPGEGCISETETGHKVASCKLLVTPVKRVANEPKVNGILVPNGLSVTGFLRGQRTDWVS